MKTLLKFTISMVFIAVAFGMAGAQFSKPEDAIQYRQAVMFLMGQHFGRMGAMVKGQIPYDKDVFMHNAGVVEMLSRLPWEAFMVPGTDKGKTALKASAFEEKARLQEYARALEANTARLLSAAKSGDFSAVKEQFGEVGKSCKACHDRFRSK